MTEAILYGIILGLALMLSMGPVFFTILKLRINFGFLLSLFFVIGVWLSDILWIVTANFFSGFLSDIVEHKNEIGLAGSFFLMGMGIYYLFFKKYHEREDGEIDIPNKTYVRLLVTGFLINTLNPGVIALWIAATAKTISNTHEQRFATFAICLLMNIGADLFKMNLAGILKKYLNEKNILLINRFTGILFILFGIAMLLHALPALV
jgi:threonine/homoserine/homoserine lactone efflux protein